MKYPDTPLSSSLLFDLNSEQQSAVSAPPVDLLILAGAGSGKTKVLVHRIAYLIQVLGFSPYSIMAVTFTNKAANEMRARVEKLLGGSVRHMMIGTFHSIAHRLLRQHWQEASLPQHFQIIDSDDQYRLIRRVIKLLQLDETRWPPKQVVAYINNRKDAGIRPDQDAVSSIYEKQMNAVYRAYEESCVSAGLVDFSELLLRAHELWIQHPELLAHYQQRYQQILVDEFQDTNFIQYAWLKRLLAASNNQLMVVGDDDQSIYGWRGAKVKNIQEIKNDFPKMQVFRLEQNYRSTGHILTAANALIDNNDARLGKNLWTDKGQGEPIAIYAAFNELDEARFVVETISQELAKGYCCADIAVLYRSNAQSRVLEEAFLQVGMPYRVYGGLRFFDRAEIKDAIAYLRLMQNRDDDAAFERVVNTPTRGIGEKTLTELRQRSRDLHQSLWQSARCVVAERALTARAENALKGFLAQLDELSSKGSSKTLPEQIELALQGSGLWFYYQKDKTEKGRAKLENLAELINAGRQFAPQVEDDLPILVQFLSQAALEASERQSDDQQDCVQLMTLHSAKGLEFSVVFICGLEEKLFPHEMCLQDPIQLEEERRLCYVGLTRAKEKCYLSYAERRILYGRDVYYLPSRFLKEIPASAKQQIRMRERDRASQTMQGSSALSSTRILDKGPLGSFSIGQRVGHAKFGTGIIINFEGRGEHARVQVQFEAVGSKWLVLSYANLNYQIDKI